MAQQLAAARAGLVDGAGLLQQQVRTSNIKLIRSVKLGYGRIGRGVSQNHNQQVPGLILHPTSLRNLRCLTKHCFYCFE